MKFYFLILTVFVVFFTFYPFEKNSIDILNFKRYAFSIMILLFLAVNFFNPLKINVRKDVLIACALLLFAFLVSTLVSYNFTKSFYVLVFCSIVVAFTIFSSQILTETLYKRLIISITIVSLIFALYSIIQISGFDIIGLGGGQTEEMAEFRLGAVTFENKNQIAGIFVMSAIFTNVFFISTKIFRMFFLLASIIFVFVISLIGSRTATLTLLITQSISLLLCYQFFKQYFKKQILIVALSVCVILLTYISGIGKGKEFVSRFSSYVRGEDLSFSHRIAMWKTALDMWLDNFVFGVGPGNYQTYMYKYQGKNLEGTSFSGLSVSAHNDYLEISATTGVLGLIAFLFLLTILLKIAYSRLRHTKVETLDDFQFVFIPFLILISFCIIALYNYPLEEAGELLVFCLAIAPLVSQICVREEKSRVLVRIDFLKENSIGILFKLISVILVVIILIPIRMGISKIYFEKAQNASEDEIAKKYCNSAIEMNDRLVGAYILRGVINLNMKNYESAKRDLEKVKKLEPYNPYTYLFEIEYLRGKNELEEALVVAKKLVELNPNSPMVRTILGKLYLMTKRYEEALKEFTKAIECWENLTDFHKKQNIDSVKDALKLKIEIENIIYREN